MKVEHRLERSFTDHSLLFSRSLQNLLCLCGSGAARKNSLLFSVLNSLLSADQ